MNHKTKDIGLGAGVVAFGVFLLLYAIPVFVSAPSNVPAIVLSPVFWPDIIAWMIIILGGILIASRVFGLAPAPSEQQSATESMTRDEVVFGYTRLAATAVIMVGLVIATPILGMVMATGIAFALISAIVMTERPVTTLILAVVLPLVLYAFFAHVAGVSVPQGRFVTLP